MAKNLSRKYATMSDDERRRFALEEEEASRELPAELSFDEPRKEDNMGPQFSRDASDEDSAGEEQRG